MIQDGAVLLVKHTYQREWYLPGGGVKRGENLEDAARREAREETGAVLKYLRLFGIFTNLVEHKSDHVIVFLCEDFALSGKTDHEIEQMCFFSLDALPEGISPGSRRRISEYKERTSSPPVGVW